MLFALHVRRRLDALLDLIRASVVGIVRRKIPRIFGMNESDNAEPPAIFVVDDDDSMRESLRSLIRSAGLNVEAFRRTLSCGKKRPRCRRESPALETF